MDKFPNGSRVTGAWYAHFYKPVAGALVAAFPPTVNTAGLPKADTGIALGGPVSYSPPFQEVAGRIDDKTWEQWVEPLLRATAVPANKPKLLGWVDFHAYNGANAKGECTKPNCRNAAAATIEMNLQQIALEGQAMGQLGLLTSITETNFALESESDETDWAQRFQQRGVGLIEQTMALLRWPGTANCNKCQLFPISSIENAERLENFP